AEDGIRDKLVTGFRRVLFRSNNHWVRRYTGTATQTVDYILSQAFPSAFTSDFRGRGVAYAAVRLKFDEASNRGQLPQISFAMKRSEERRVGKEWRWRWAEWRG